MYEFCNQINEHMNEWIKHFMNEWMDMFSPQVSSFPDFTRMRLNTLTGKVIRGRCHAAESSSSSLPFYSSVPINTINSQKGGGSFKRSPVNHKPQCSELSLPGSTVFRVQEAPVQPAGLSHFTSRFNDHEWHFKLPPSTNSNKNTLMTKFQF